MISRHKDKGSRLKTEGLAAQGLTWSALECKSCRAAAAASCSQFNTTISFPSLSLFKRFPFPIKKIPFPHAHICGMFQILLCATNASAIFLLYLPLYLRCWWVLSHLLSLHKRFFTWNNDKLNDFHFSISVTGGLILIQ